MNKKTQKTSDDAKSCLKNITQTYSILLENYSPQGWWPLLDHEGKNPTKTGSIRGYHPADYSLPKTEAQKFEICIGAILTQNTAWPNVERALLNLKAKNALTPEGLINLIGLDEQALKSAIRPACYFNQKAKKLRIFSEFFIGLKGRAPSREELLSVWGIGKETADSILLYAYKEPYFVVDAYTKRIFSRLGWIKEDANYDTIRTLFESSLSKDRAAKDLYQVYQEYHALIVEHAKRSCRKAPECEKCVLRQTQRCRSALKSCKKFLN